MVEIPTAANTNDAEQPAAGGGPAEAKSREPLWRQMLGGSLREQRNELGETLDEVANRAGVSRQYLSEIERGLKEPSSEIIAAVSGALGTTLLDLTLDVAQSLATVSVQAAQVSISQASFALAA